MYKFPSTPYLANLGSVPIRGDKVLSDQEREAFLKHEIIVEEKIDGANLGISFNLEGQIICQNRGSIISSPYVGQWKKLPDWLDSHADRLFDALGMRYLLFGEWCFAVHSIEYTRLPNWFIGFDVFDLEVERFLATRSRDEILKRAGLPIIAEIARGRFELEDLVLIMRRSSYGDEPCEGLYLRIDEGKWLKNRAKLVRPEFTQAIEVHWSKKALKPNRIEYDWV